MLRNTHRPKISGLKFQGFSFGEKLGGLFFPKK